MSLITVIGRGHSGTRAISHTLSASGVYMGGMLNISGDLVPPHDMYDACRVMSRYVRYLGNLKWDFSELFTMPIDPEFIDLVNSYLTTVMESTAIDKGWKLPETTLVFPWITRMFPEAKYILWVRDPRDSIIGGHVTDDLSDFNIPYEKVDDIRERRAISWKYQREIMKATPAPRYSIKIRFEDFVLNQDETLARLEEFLGIPLAKIPVRTDSIGRWKTDEGKHDFPMFLEDLGELGYR
ncbi:MAG: sulfotransferase [Clostridia bacterium]|nr:sulfotransferase [Clostridia bacterium]